MANLYYFPDANDEGYHGFRCITEGTSPDRFWVPDFQRVQAAAEHRALTPFRLPPPAKGYSDALNIGDGHQFRYEPVRVPSWDREGMHAVLGAVDAALLFAGLYLGGNWFWAAAIVAVVSFLSFMVYEVVEGFRLNDWGYRDVGGWKIGWRLVPVVVFIGAVVWKLWDRVM